MSPSSKRILEQLEFDRRLPQNSEKFDEYGFYYNGAKWQHARLLPILTALLEDRDRLREALAFYRALSNFPLKETIAAYDSGGSTFEFTMRYTALAKEALTASAEVDKKLAGDCICGEINARHCPVHSEGGGE